MHIGSAWNEMSRPFLFIQRALCNVAQAFSWLQEQAPKPGPIFPEILDLWGYERIHAWLACVYLLVGCGLGWAWAMFLRWRNMGLWVQALAACFPALVYYSFLVSTDLLYAVLIAMFYATAWAVLLLKQRAWIWCMVVLLIAILSRPNALAMIPVLFIILATESTLKWWTKSLWMIVWSLFGLYMLIYYLPYFWLHEGNSAGTPYWGIYPRDFHEGIFTWLPDWINKTFSLLFLGISKILYSVGLRPSYSGVSLWLVLVRASPAVLLLPGLILVFFCAHWFERVFIFFFMIPIYVGASQERYLLAITPLLLFWGMQFYKLLYKILIRNNVKVD
jgi:hypothetical protein